jgi:hypothetical protein
MPLAEKRSNDGEKEVKYQQEHTTKVDSGISRKDATSLGYKQGADRLVQLLEHCATVVRRIHKTAVATTPGTIEYIFSTLHGHRQHFPGTSNDIFLP